MKLILNGVEYDDVLKRLKKVPVLYWIELEDQAGINSDAIDSGSLSFRRMLAAFAYLLRRDNGEAVTFKQAALELIPDDALVDEPADDDSSDGEGDPDPSSDALSTPSGD
jgi:hypothetical protein